jgi:hypothetical protein
MAWSIVAMLHTVRLAQAAYEERLLPAGTLDFLKLNPLLALLVEAAGKTRLTERW